MHNTNWPCFADNFQVTKLPPGSPTHLLSSQYFPAVRCIPWLLVRVNWTLVSVSATNRPCHNLPETDCKNWAMPGIKRGRWQLDEEVLSLYRCCHTGGRAIWDKMQRKTEFGLCNSRGARYNSLEQCNFGYSKRYYLHWDPQNTPLQEQTLENLTLKDLFGKKYMFFKIVMIVYLGFGWDTSTSSPDLLPSM